MDNLFLENVISSSSLSVYIICANTNTNANTILYVFTHTLTYVASCQEHIKKAHPEESKHEKQREENSASDNGKYGGDNKDTPNVDEEGSPSQEAPGTTQDTGMSFDIERVSEDDEICECVQSFIKHLRAAFYAAEADNKTENIAKVAKLVEGFHKEVRENQHVARYLQTSSSPKDDQIEVVKTLKEDFVKASKVMENWRLGLQKDDLCEIVVKPPIELEKYVFMM